MENQKLPYSDFGLEAKIVMLHSGFKQKDLAEQLGISCSYLYEILKGTRLAPAYKKKIAEILGLKKYLSQ